MRHSTLVVKSSMRDGLPTILILIRLTGNSAGWCEVFEKDVQRALYSDYLRKHGFQSQVV